MNYFFIVEDKFGPGFFQKFFNKKLDEGFFQGKLTKTIRLPIGPKMTRVIKTVVHKVDRIIILADADGKSLESKESDVLQYVDSEHTSRVRIVLFDYEIEDWICYSLGIKPCGKKPSLVLERKRDYRKNRMPRYANDLDCQALQNCRSFKSLVDSLRN